jgi:hypothetical protein
VRENTHLGYLMPPLTPIYIGHNFSQEGQKENILQDISQNYEIFHIITTPIIQPEKWNKILSIKKVI